MYKPPAQVIFCSFCFCCVGSHKFFLGKSIIFNVFCLKSTTVIFFLRRICVSVCTCVVASTTPIWPPNEHCFESVIVQLFYFTGGQSATAQKCTSEQIAEKRRQAVERLKRSKQQKQQQQNNIVAKDNPYMRKN